MRDVVEDGNARVGRRRFDQLEHVRQVGLETTPVVIHRAGPVEHGRDEHRPARREAEAERLVRGRAVGAELIERRTGHGTDGGQRRGQVGAAREIDDDDRLAQPDRGVHELKTGGRGAGPGRAGDQHAAGDLGPGQGGPATGKVIYPQAGPIPRDDPPGSHRPDDRGAADRNEQPRARGPHLPLIGVQPVEPGGERSLRCPGHQRNRKLPGQPMAHARVRHAEVQQPCGVAVDTAQIGHDLSRARGEPGCGRGRPDGQRPHQPGSGWYRQPGRAPPADLGDAQEDKSQDQRELGEDHMQDHQRHTDRSKELATVRRIPGYHVACTPWRALRRRYRLGWHRH